MRKYPDAPRGNDGVLEWINTVSKLRREDVLEVNNLNGRLVQGRLRTDRTVPTSFSDVTANDRVGDIVRSGSYEYIVVNDSGTLKWARIALDVSW